jgi:hypothetical protein
LTHCEVVLAVHESQIDEVLLQSIEVAAVQHPTVLEDLESVDLENGFFTRVTDVGGEAAALVQVDEVPIDGTPGYFVMTPP